MAAVLLDVEVIEGTKVRSIIDEFEKENSMDSRLAHGDKIAKAKAFAKEQALKKIEEEKEEALKNS
jgi:cell division protease FtsH